MLKARLEKDERWKSFASQSGQAKSAIQQTELAFLVPPSQRSKARFMNLHELVKWGRETLALMDDPCRLEAVPFKVSMERVRAKLGWLVEFREALAEWSQWHEVIEAALNFVRCRGLYVGAGVDMAAALPAVSASTVIELREELIRFVTVESSKARIGERLPGTTEVLESCFGKLKALEDGQSKSGFTGLVLSLGAIVSKRTIETIGEALERCRVRDVWDWCREKLGVSVQSLRKQAYTKTKCQQIPDDREVGTRPSFHHVRTTRRSCRPTSSERTAGVVFFAMPLVDGFALSQVLDQRRQYRAGQPPLQLHRLAVLSEPRYIDAVARVLVRVAWALEDAHASRVVHCDVKPANILLDRSNEERTYLIDFGMGRDLDAMPRSPSESAGGHGAVHGAGEAVGPPGGGGPVRRLRAGSDGFRGFRTQAAAGRPRGSATLALGEIPGGSRAAATAYDPSPPAGGAGTYPGASTGTGPEAAIFVGGGHGRGPGAVPVRHSVPVLPG